MDDQPPVVRIRGCDRVVDVGRGASTLPPPPVLLNASGSCDPDREGSCGEEEGEGGFGSAGVALLFRWSCSRLVSGKPCGLTGFPQLRNSAALPIVAADLQPTQESGGDDYVFHLRVTKQLGSSSNGGGQAGGRVSSSTATCVLQVHAQPFHSQCA